MNLFSFVMSVVILASGTAWAQNPPPSSNPIGNQPSEPQEIVEFSGRLSIASCYGESCGVGIGFGNFNNQVLLKRIDSDPFHLRGYYTDIQEVDGVRFIGIVTVDRWGYPVGESGAVQYSYQFTVEILGRHGTDAEMSISVDDPARLSSVSLRGREIAVGPTRYTPAFSIGPRQEWECVPVSPAPPENGGEVLPPCEISRPVDPIDGDHPKPLWIVQKGSLL